MFKQFRWMFFRIVRRRRRYVDSLTTKSQIGITAGRHHHHPTVSSCLYHFFVGGFSLSSCLLSADFCFIYFGSPLPTDTPTNTSLTKKKNERIRERGRFFHSPLIITIIQIIIRYVHYITGTANIYPDSRSFFVFVVFSFHFKTNFFIGMIYFSVCLLFGLYKFPRPSFSPSRYFFFFSFFTNGHERCARARRPKN